MSAQPSSKPTSPVNSSSGLESRNASGNSPDAATQGEMIDSLGVALAGVNLSSSGKPSSSNGGLFSSSNDSASPFSMGTGPTQPESELGWASTFSDASKSAFSGSAAPPAPADLGQEAHVKESLDLFLSQSPSQTLGDDVFKLSTTNLPALALSEGDRRPNGESSPFGFGNNGGSNQHNGHGPSLSNNAAPAPSGVFGDMHRVPEPRARRNDSPSVTGTTASSRSASPYANHNANSSEARGGSIPAFRYDNSSGGRVGSGGDLLVHRQASYGEDDRQSQVHNMSHGYSSHPNIPALDNRGPPSQQRFGSQSGSSKNLFGTVGAGSPYEKDRNYPGQRIEPPPPPPSQHVAQSPQQQQAQPQPQVLYMAVPTPDGRGQVLQPVQMLQVQGKGFTYVVPQGVNQASLNGAMAMLPPLQNNHENGNGLIGNEQRNPTGDYRNNKSYSLDVMKQDDYNGMSKGGGKYNMTAGGHQDPASSLYATTQRPPLDALLGQVRRLSRDQVGCRLVQQALDEEGAMAATLILNEGLPFWSEAMVDPFGNYLFQKILEKITAEERIMLVKTVSSRLVNASLNLHGTRSVQKIVELCAADEDAGFNSETQDESAADILTRSLFPAAARLCIDSHGNHVIQRILLKLGSKHTKFVFDAVAASVGDVARHRHGCCVIQRCLDSPVGEARSHLVNRIVEKSLELMQDAYGNYVVQYVLDVCSDEDVHAVCESVIGKVNLLAIQKFSSNVMEKCLERCTDSVKEMYMQELSDPERVRELMMDPFGNYVVQRALSVATHSQAIRLVEAMRPHLVSTQPGFPNGQRSGGVRNTAGGRRIMAKICRRFPNFTLSAVGSQDELFSQSKNQHRQAANSFGAPGHHGLATYAPMPGGHRVQHYNGDPGAIAGPHLVMNQQQAYYDTGNVNVGYFDHTFTDHAFGGPAYGGQNYGGFPNM
ncbi:Pumilio domain-containing protein C6G9.14 [Seminavis robusta]|uniref:Pumilio domain-containing protein C6G9.14 n=1 Tax=Seminavis robusta TaxID=568900 RepID=A0A9N8E042_9STRA|nr:Pumilio domain-containing protein C6G9.14 [Seminavis robusta]|eukprot:Sro517_g158610.1 Pumilio domain-containing protein C6G9.14 (937) ;mRNA; f:6508-9318